MKKTKILTNPFCLLSIFCLIMNFLTFFSNIKLIVNILIIFTVAISAVTIYLKFLKKLNFQELIFIISLISFLLRAIYIFYTPYYQRQHDSGLLSDDSGHLAYIQYFLYNNFSFPKFDPRTVWQFYHPPLHHFIAAIWMKLNLLLGMNLDSAAESIQVLTLFYSCSFTIICYKIFNELCLSKISLIIPYLICCFHPSLIILSGSINNDILCLTLMLAAILYSIKWYKNPNTSNIIKIALFVGFSALTKLSGLLVAPAIAFLFLAKYIKSYKTKNNMLNQFLIFIIICFPLSMFKSIYNFVKFKMPLNYVPLLSSNIGQYIGNYPLHKRFLDFNLNQLKSVFIAFGKPYYEYNIFIALLKSSMFDEFNLSKINQNITIPATILFCINFLIVVISLGCMAIFITKKVSNISINIKIFLLIFYAVIFLSYIKFCIDFPHTCTQDFRYIVPTFVIGAIAIGEVLENRKNFKHYNLFISITVFLTVTFCILSSTVYILLGL